MDNLTHSLTGLAAGELIHRCLPAEPDSEAMRLRRRLMLFSCWFASNFPDLDLVLTPLLPEPLGYLLHHRGHTHTFFYALPQALLVFASVWLLVPAARALFRQSKAARIGMALSVLVGLVLHMAMDYLNSYGIHPFHPFDSRWFYGDMVFILEPVFWVIFGVPLIMMIPKRWFRWLLLAALPAVLLYFTVKGYLLWSSFAALLFAGVILAALQKPANTQGVRVLLAAFGLGFAFIVAQAAASRDARETLAGILETRHARGVMLDAALTPFPSNPLCWTFVSVESNESAGTYQLRKGLLSLAPQLLPVAGCPPSLLAAPVGMQASREAVFLEQYEGSLHTLRTFKEENCRVRAWLRFARAPKLENDAASDMRFSFRSRDNFTSMDFSVSGEDVCGSYVPPWDFPRQDLLSGSAKP